MPAVNLDADVVLTYKTLFGIYDNGNHSTGNLETFDSLVEARSITEGNFEKYYSATGKKRKKIIGDSSQFIWKMKKTTTLIDTVNPPTNIRTLSYWQYKINVLREHVEGALEFLQEGESASTKFLHDQAIVSIDKMEDVRDEQTGALWVEVTAEFLEWKKNQREAT